MRNLIFILLVAGLLTSCGAHRKLQRNYTGKPVAVLQNEYGNPSSVIERENDTIYIFEKSEELNSTEISQGKLTLDPIVTPAVVKTSRYYFTVKNGIITEIRTDEEYQR